MSVIAGFSFVGIMRGVAALIIVMSVMNGFRTEFLDRILGVNGHIVYQATGGPLDDYADVSDRIATVPGVEYAMPLVQGQVLATGAASGNTGALAKGVRGGDLERLAPVSSNVLGGTLDGFDGFDGSDGVAIGSRLAAALGLQVGDLITLVGPDGEVTPIGVLPRRKTYPVAAVFEIGMSEYDQAYVYMPLSEAQLFFNSEGRVQSLEIFVDDPD